MALIACKDCQQEFSTDAKHCPKCGANRYRPRYILKGFLILLFISWMMAHYAPSDTNAAHTGGVAHDSAAVTPQWQYTTEQDAMTSKSITTAIIDSTNTLSFDFPYRGEQHVQLELRNHPRFGKNVIFSIEKGQFMCHIDGCSVLVRFDEEPPVRFSAGEPADHDSTYIFLNGYANFLSKMSKAKKVRIAADFYQNGQQTAEFDTSHFDPAQYK